jgi:hypothetical protein
MQHERKPSAIRRRNPRTKPSKIFIGEIGVDGITRAVSLTPINSSVANEKVASAALLPPYRRHQADRAVWVPVDVPRGTNLLQEVELD